MAEQAGFNNPLRVTPLGGAAEIGKNCFLYEYDGKLMMVDCGLKFPEQDMLGIDIVIPDFDLVTARQEDLVAVVLTHGHEDHIGAVAYLLQRLEHAEIYGTELTLALLAAKLEEAGLENYNSHPVEPPAKLELGPFQVQCLRVSHSIPDGLALVIETPAARVLHTGDFKFDPTPISSYMTDFAGLTQAGEEGVDLLMVDVTGVEKPGYTPSEQLVVKTLKGIIEEAPGRVIVATFASNLHRIGETMRLAVESGRRTFLCGYSMEKNVRVALRLGLIELPEHHLISREELSFLPTEEVLIMSTGSQGEPMSGLSLMAAGRHSEVQIQEGDTVVLSASPIPGNEALVYKVINSLFRAGARVLYDRLASVHVSGHAAREGIKLMCSLAKPNYAIPIHGEPRHSYLFKEMAVDELGFLPEEVMIVRPGQVLELEDGLVRFGEEIEARSLLVDGLEITAWNRSLFRERLALAEEGVIIISAVVDGQTGDPLVEVAVTGKGFSADEARASALLTELSANLSQIARDVAGKNYSSTTLQSRLVETARRFLTQTTGRRPVILPHVVEV